ncbi:Shedu immune nuclease family protein [Mycobacterium intracellulare]|uniref:Shedu immune nuclease family protein n=1 Tax=Mycobacterium intracellulare TaxID=1767 RepID=UPI000BAADD9D|nr:Shedu immune nuclease family protein [Mycobacterium intracellulare]ASW84754.1 hypothetical protein CKJ61_07505 [Mycobacterium intracellulare]
MAEDENPPKSDGKSKRVITVNFPPVTIAPGQGTKFSREGLSWFVKQLVFADGDPRTYADLTSAIEQEVEQVKPIAESTEGFAELAAGQDVNLDFLKKLTKGRDSSPEKWATAFYLYGSGLFADDTALDDKDRLVILWLLAKFRTMYLFAKHIQDLAWRGYQNYGVDVLAGALTTWNLSDKAESEDYWQQYLQEQPYLINLIFPGPVAVHTGKAYLGGKKIDNTGGQVVDFLLEHSIGGNAALLEIKRPGTALLMKTAYRGDEIYAASSELTGAVSQILNYRDTIMTGRSTSPIEVFVPSCVVLAGNYKDELDSPGKRRSFELYRSSLNGVSIITYDELFDRLKKILDVLRGEG